VKVIRITVVCSLIFAVCFALVACSSRNPGDLYGLIENPGTLVRVISGGVEHDGLPHWNHGSGSFWNASGWFKHAEDIADELTPFIFHDDFQIIVDGQVRSPVGYIFYKLIDDKWEEIITVSNSGSNARIDFSTRRHFFADDSENEREQWIYRWSNATYDNFLTLFEPGEYILDVHGWWNNNRSAASNSYNNFFRFIIQ